MIAALLLFLAAARPSVPPPCSTRDYLALRCGGAGDTMEKDGLSETDNPRAEVRAYRRAEVRRERKEYRDNLEVRCAIEWVNAAPEAQPADCRRLDASWKTRECRLDGSAAPGQAPIPCRVRLRALRKLVRVEHAYDRIKHPTLRQDAAYRRQVDRLSAIVCPNGMNDNDGDGNVGCD